MQPKTKVLFLCSRNAIRSQMAEALLRRYASDTFDVYSAGVVAEPIHPYTIRVMQEIGIDMSGYHSKSTRTYLGFTNFGYVITLSPEAEENSPHTFLSQGAKRLNWPFEDPRRFQGSAEEHLQKFREVRDAIDAKILEWLRELNVPIQNAPPLQADL
jgi:arsenate reductase